MGVFKGHTRSLDYRTSCVWGLGFRVKGELWTGLSKLGIPFWRFS